MEHDIDLTADLNAQDDDGLGWSTPADAPDPSRVRTGLDAARRQSACTGRRAVFAVDDDGQVDFSILRGSVAKNRHLLVESWRDLSRICHCEQRIPCGPAPTGADEPPLNTVAEQH